ncbi:YncE family protein [Ectobacillus panaciterrae]|uniref:YncE family protein n=1 Tax=Ectobacillus panaciterrae TaxID=363872 RepID=UPI0004140D8A|nr:YncE family protein [Ectobacillus panaciterrae]
MKRWMILILLVVVLAGCNAETYTSVSSKEPILITTNIKEGSISFIDTNSNRVLTTWHLNKAMMGTVLFPDGDTLAVYGKQLENVYLYSLKDGKKIDEWKTGKGIANALVSYNGKDVILADQQTNTVKLYTIEGKKKAEISVGHSPMTMVQDEKHVYVMNFQDTKLSVIDWDKQKISGTMSIPFSSIGAQLSGSELWLGGHGNGEEVNESVHIYDTNSNQLIRSIPAPSMPISFATDNTYIYVLSHGSATLRKFNAATYHEEATLEVGSNPFAVSLEGSNLYVASYDSNEVYVIDTKTMKVIKTLSVGKGPFHFTERKGERA